MDTLTNAITPDQQEKIDNYFESISLLSNKKGQFDL